MPLLATRHRLIKAALFVCDMSLRAKARPPTFAFSSRGHAVPESYIRYLINSLRETFDFAGVPIRFFIRKGKNPYDDKS